MYEKRRGEKRRGEERRGEKRRGEERSGGRGECIKEGRSPVADLLVLVH